MEMKIALGLMLFAQDFKRDKGQDAVLLRESYSALP